MPSVRMMWMRILVASAALAGLVLLADSLAQDVADPAKRGPGFLCTVIANAALLLGGVVGALIALR